MLLFAIGLVSYQIFVVISVNHFIITEESSYDKVAWRSAFLFYLLVILAFLTYFFVFHFSCLLEGHSYFESVKRVKKIRPYLWGDDSCWTNFKAIFGNNPLFWLIPFGVREHEIEIYK